MTLTDNEYIKYMEFISEIDKNKQYGLNDKVSEKEFIKHIALLNPQSYGFRIEKRISKDLGSGCKRIKASENRGDLFLHDKYIEVKSSVITPINPSLNVVQIRLYQDLDYYLCCAFDLRDVKKYKSYLFLLTHDEMKKEMDLVTSSSAHGTKSSLKDNKNIELRYSLNIDEKNEVFKRWSKKYGYNTFKEISKKIKRG